MAPMNCVLNVSLLERPIPRPLPRELVGYVVVWIPEEQRYRFIVVEHGHES